MGVARVTAQESSWRVHRFEVLSGGEPVCRVEALRMQESLLLWIGRAGGVLGDIALGMPQAGGEALATPLLGDAAEASGLSRRLSAALSQPVLVCLGLPLDRFTAPLLERALVAEIKSRPECF